MSRGRVGAMAVRHLALRFGVPEALILASVAVAAFLLLGSRPEVRRTIAREEKALAAVRDAAASEHEYVARRVRDANGDKAYEYGGLEDLRAAGLLRRHLASDAEGPYMVVVGYRLE